MPRSLAMLCVMLLSFTYLMAADAPATTPADTDVVRLFRLRLTNTDDWYRFVAADPSIDDATRAELNAVLESRARIIDAEIEKIWANPLSLKELNSRISQLDSELAKIPAEAKLFRDNPVARLRFERRTNAAMSIAMGHFENRKELADAVLKAGLPAERQQEALKIIDNAHQHFLDSLAAYLPQERKLNQLPAGDAKDLAIEAMQAQAQQIWFGMGRTLYLQLRGLLQPDQYDAFDQAVPKVGW